MNEPGRPARPKLVAVPAGEGAERAAPAAGPPSRRAWLPLLLGVALALCAAALAAQARHAAALADRLAAAETSLARAEAQLAAWDLWRTDVRSRADRVGQDLRDLDAALARDPSESVPRK